MNIADKQERFLELYEDSRESLVRFAKSMARNPEDAKDLIQETTLAAFERFDSLKNPQAFVSFLFTIASRIHKRQNWRKRLFFKFKESDAEDAFFEELSSNESSPDSGYDIYALRKALKRLPDEQREAVVLHEISGLKMEEIADIQKCSVSGVKSRVQRGRKELERIMFGDDNKDLLSDNEYSEKNSRTKFFKNANSIFRVGILESKEAAHEA
jgi:RNA polymerase sigma-70 factor (ECF subfamily)